jgi:tRNA nucleotidyltransferase (CCA-adding enzyme)
MRTTILKKDVHPLALEVCSQLQGHGHQAFIVGGCVRDLLLEVTPKDWDIASDASPEEVMAIFPRTIPTGLQHGTVTVCMGEGDGNHFEVTTFRVEGEYLDGRRPEEVRFVKRIEEDLARRDLTINAIAYDPISNTAVDPFAGIFDLKNGNIRAVGNPVARFQEDGLRIMRVARFAARFGYQVEEETLKGMKESLETLKMVSKERVSDELCKTLMAPYADYGITILLASGALGIACPLLVSQKAPLLPTQTGCQGELETRLAFLYSKLPAHLVKQELIDLKLSTKEIKRVVFLLTTLEQFFSFKECSTPLSYKKFMARIKNEGPDPWEHTYQQFIELARALELPFEKLSFYEGEIVLARKELAINGDDLMAQGVKPGPSLKILLDSCYSEVLEHPERNNKEFLLQFCLTISN